MMMNSKSRKDCESTLSIACATNGAWLYEARITLTRGLWLIKVHRIWNEVFHRKLPASATLLTSPSSLPAELVTVLSTSSRMWTARKWQALFAQKR